MTKNAVNIIEKNTIAYSGVGFIINIKDTVEISDF